MYKEFISKKEFNGSLGKLIEEIVEAFVNEGVVKSKFGDFYNIAGIIEIEDYEDITFNFNIGIDGVGLDMDEVLEEEVIEKFVIEHFIDVIRRKSRELDVDGQIKEIRTLLNNHIKATYTLACS